MKILVSGGVGFIGSHLLQHVLRDEDMREVAIFDNFIFSQRSYLSKDSDPSRVIVVQVDLKNLDAVKAQISFYPEDTK
jgi:UDP-glucose 4-epimerase